MSKDGIWQDSNGMKDSEMVENWTKVLHTVEDAMKQPNYQKTASTKKKENIAKPEENKNG